MTDKLQKSIPFLFYYEPFFADVFRIFNKISTTQIPTAGVCVNKSGDVDFLYNPAWFEELTLSQLYFVCKHEIYHVLLGHIFERLRKPLQIWNVAADSKINEMIIQDAKHNERNQWRYRNRDVNFVEVTERDFRKFVEERKFITYESIMEKCYEHMSEKNNLIVPGCKKTLTNKDEWVFKQRLKSFLEDSAAEKIFDYLCENMPEDAFGGYGGAEHLEPQFEGGEGDLINEIAKSKLEKQIDEINKESIVRGYGNVPKHIQEILQKLFAKKTVDWQTLLRYFVKTTIKGHKYNSIRRINKRFPYIHSGTKHRRYAKILIGVDESGSMSNQLITNLFSELQNLANIVQFDVVPFDYELDEKDLWTWKKGKKIPEYRRKRYGGTSFVPVSKLAVSGKYDGLIIVTDCEAPFPHISGIRRMWLTDERGYKYCSWKDRELVVCSPIKEDRVL